MALIALQEAADDYDAIVLGAGAGGMAAAATAAADGLRVLLIEKSRLVGGTTAVSGGMVWVPGNGRTAGAACPDTLERARRYLDHTVPEGRDGALLDTYVAQAAPAVADLERRTSVRLRPAASYPDYHPDLPGASPGGRVLEPEPFDGRRLGAHFPLLRRPLPEFMLFGGMMVARSDIAHFRRLARSPRSLARVLRLVAGYGWQRLRADRGTTLHLGNALAGQLFHSLLALGADILLGASVQALTREGRRVTGLSVAAGGLHRRIAARGGVVLATGGFSHSAERRARHLPPGTLPVSPVSPDSTGDGLALALGAGGRFAEGLRSNAFWVPASRFRRPDGSDGVFPHTVTDRAKPGVIAVDRTGRRFANEAQSYHAFVEAMFGAGRPAIPAYLVCDRAFVWKYGLGAVRPYTLSLKRHVASGYLAEAGDLGALAERLGIDPCALTDTVRRYNADARRGVDREHGRGSDVYQRYLGDADHAPNPCVAPIERPPFYALAVHPSDLGTAAGLATGPCAEVLDGDGVAIEGLYACGNDMKSIMEGSYPGPGITIGPALTFGWLAARAIAGRL